MLLIADTTVISNFVLIGRLDLLEGIKDLCATKEVWDELEVANKRGILEISQTDLKAEILRMDEDETWKAWTDFCLDCDIIQSWMSAHIAE